MENNGVTSDLLQRDSLCRFTSIFVLHLLSGNGPPPALAPNAFFLFQILPNSAGRVVLLDLAELFNKENWSCVSRVNLPGLVFISGNIFISSHLTLQLLPPLRGQVLWGSEHL